jgi:hypothetical protein
MWPSSQQEEPMDGRRRLYSSTVSKGTHERWEMPKQSEPKRNAEKIRETQNQEEME